MDGLIGLECFFPRAKSVPANGEVYKQVYRRLKRLAQIQSLVRDTSLFDRPVNYLSNLWNTMHPSTPFRLDNITSADQIEQEIQQARSWLLQIIDLQARHLPKENIIRILRFAIERPARLWTDIEKLYMTLTDEKYSGEEDSLEYAFSFVLHYRYAPKYAQVLNRLQEREDRRTFLERKRDLSGSSQEATRARADATRARILHKMQSVKVDNFACAVTISSLIHLTSENNGACPICRNEYLDFASFEVQDLIADYPVKIKHCGHVIGKSCLETWMDTPLVDPAKYPHRTCPLCRTEIEGVELPSPPHIIQQHIEENQKAISLADSLRLEDEECWDALLRLMSEAVVLEELMIEVEGRILTDGEKGYLSKAKTVLRDKSRELREERAMWGLGPMGGDWAKAEKDWMETMVET